MTIHCYYLCTHHKFVCNQVPSSSIIIIFHCQRENTHTRTKSFASQPVIFLPREKKLMPPKLLITSVQFNYFLLLFNYYASILFVDVQFFHSNAKKALAEFESSAHLRGLGFHGPQLGCGPCRSCLKWFL